MPAPFYPDTGDSILVGDIARVIRRPTREALYHCYITGKCYKDESVRREQMGCPRIYGQSTDDDDVLEAFECMVYGYIPNCPKFKSGDCWKKFDELGLKMK